MQKHTEATFTWMITSTVPVVLTATIVILTLYLLRAKNRRQKEVVIENNIAALEQKALQAMMNPHFVFNIMNSIQHFINQADLKAANQILAGFARLARKHLEICMNSTISVQEELEYLQNYLYLEKIRCSDKMEYEITIEEEIDSDEIFIPSMLIQPFIENAIWHGIMPKDEGGLIKIKFELIESDLSISILDNGVGISNSKPNNKAEHISRGMTLIRERVRLLNKLNKNRISIDQKQSEVCGTEVLIKIPIQKGSHQAPFFNHF
ncbi:MAG: sensor histidine kinase [Daejeonella sp.]